MEDKKKEKKKDFNRTIEVHPDLKAYRVQRDRKSGGGGQGEGFYFKIKHEFFGEEPIPDK